MADSAAPMGATSPTKAGDVTKRDFLKLTTTAFAVVTVGAIAWPFIRTLAPAADVLALASTDVDIDPIAEGMAITVMWRGKPVFVRHRTAAEIEAARAPVPNLPDPQEDADRVQRPEWLVVLGICTHLGCVPLGQRPADQRGEFGGWFCPCHGSHYDTSGRIRRGPAPRNLDVPEYTFTSDTSIRIG